jgi:drug/metabolite transporter (DMT)-like permease
LLFVRRNTTGGSVVSARGWTLFAAVSVIWGMPYLFIKLAVDEMSPSLVAWSRLAIAAAVLLPVAWKLGALRGLGARWQMLAFFAAVEMAIPWPLIGFGEVRISSSLTAILIAAVPLVVALIALRFDHSERPTRTRLVGMLVGFAGVASLVGIDIGGRAAELAGAGAILLAAVCYAIGPMIVKRRLSDVDPLGPVAASLGIAALLVTPFAAADLPETTPSADALVSVAVLGLVCSALAFLLFFRLIAEVGPGRATIITYINPVVALALGVAILGESVTAGAVVGLLLILAGSWLSTDGRLPPGLGAVVARVRWRRGRRPTEVGAMPLPREERIADPARG